MIFVTQLLCLGMRDSSVRVNHVSFCEMSDDFHKILKNDDGIKTLLEYFGKARFPLESIWLRPKLVAVSHVHIRVTSKKDNGFVTFIGGV